MALPEPETNHDVKFSITEGNTNKSLRQSSAAEPERAKAGSRLRNEAGSVKGTNQIVCEYCQAMFTNKNLLRNHLRVHAKLSKRYTCELCSKQFRDTFDLDRHVRVHTGEKPYTCSFCDKRFADKYSVAPHISKFHCGESRERRRKAQSFTCNICKKCFGYAESLRNHELMHPENDSNEAIQQHCRHKCAFCGKKYHRKKEYERHMTVHIGEKPYSCPVCDRAFNDAGHLKRHQKVVHKNQTTLLGKVIKYKETKGKFKCAYCDKKYAQKHSLDGHLRTHTGELPFACDTCPKSFRYQEALDRHQAVHTAGVKPSRCSKCSQASLQTSLLQIPDMTKRCFECNTLGRF